MDRADLIYYTYVLALFVFMSSIVLTPYLAFTSDMSGAYKAFEYTCHQKLSRSLCLFGSVSGYWIADCTNQSGKYVNDIADRNTIRVEAGSSVGYKLPVCARDLGIYGAMLIAAVIYPYFRKIDERDVFPAIYFALALIPIGLDGGVQLVSDMGLLPFVYESTNLIRLLTGAIAGGAASFYAIPILVNLFGQEEGRIGAEARASRRGARK